MRMIDGGLILLVDDEDTIRNLTSRILRGEGYAVHDVASGEAAVEFARDYEGSIDLLITDIVLPGLDGGQTAEALRGSRPGLAVLQMSGYCESSVHGATANPPYHFMAKPFRGDRFAQCVRTIMGETRRDRRISSPPIAEPLEILRVLIADHDATSRALFASRVHRLGHSIATAATGIEAWEDVEQLRPHLVIADWRLPGIDGLELCRRIHERVGDECFVILLTGDAEEDLDLVLDAGADDYLTKPVTAHELRARILLARRRLQQRHRQIDASRWRSPAAI